MSNVTIALEIAKEYQSERNELLLKVIELEQQIASATRFLANESLVKQNDELRAQLAMESARLDAVAERGWRVVDDGCNNWRVVDYWGDVKSYGESFREAIDAARAVQ